MVSGPTTVAPAETKHMVGEAKLHPFGIGGYGFACNPCLVMDFLERKSQALERKKLGVLILVEAVFFPAWRGSLYCSNQRCLCIWNKL